MGWSGYCYYWAKVGLLARQLHMAASGTRRAIADICTNQITKWNSSNHNVYLLNIFVQSQYLYLSKVVMAGQLHMAASGRRRAIADPCTNQTPKCICSNHKVYLSNWVNVFVLIAIYICPNCNLYLSKVVLARQLHMAASGISRAIGDLCTHPSNIKKYFFK